MKSSNLRRMIFVAGFAVAVCGWLAQSAVAAQFFGAIQTSLPTGQKVNGNLYTLKSDVYLTGGPQNLNSQGLPDGIYYFQVTNPNGSVLLSTDEAICRQVVVSGGKFSAAVPATDFGSNQCEHIVSLTNAANGSVPVQLGRRSDGFFTDTPNNGGEYKAWLIAKSVPGLNCTPTVGGDLKSISFPSNCAKTDNFKVKQPGCAAGIGPFPNPFGGPDVCFAVMPVRKRIATRTPSCDSPVVSINGNITTETTTCTDAVVGSVDRVCTFDNTNTQVPNPTRVCSAANVNYLNVFETDLFPNVGGQPGGFPTPAARLWIPPEEDPLAPQGASFSICEVNIPPGWYLPDNGVTTSTDGGTPVPVPVYTPTASTSNPTDRNRCWNVTIPVANTFEIFINNVPVGKIVVSKESVGGKGTFTFAASGGGDCAVPENPPLGTDICTAGGFSGNPAFTLNTNTSNPIQTDPPYTVDARVFFSLANPAYKVDETGLPAGDWDTTVDPTSCTNGFGVTPNGIVTCAFKNTKRGHIIVDKVTNPSGDSASFGFTLTGGPDSIDQSFSLTDAAAPQDSGAIKPGTYTLTETGVPITGWDITSISCEVTTTGEGGSTGTGTLSTGVTSITLKAGDTLTCTYTNTKRGHIVTDKVTDPSGDSKLFDFTLTGGPDSINQSFQLADATAPKDSGLIKPGTYTLTETGLPITGWDLTGISCSVTTTGAGGSTGSGTLLTGATSITLNAGDTLTCTYTNTKRSHIVTDKVTVPPGDPTSFAFTLTGGPAPPINQSFSLTDAATPQDSGLIRPGSYTLTETGLPIPGWTLTGISCSVTTGSNGSTGTGNLTTGATAITLKAGDTLTCTYTNNRNGTITSSALCTFDVDGDTPGSQFRLIYTNDPNNPLAYKNNASNPGQFYYNVFYSGAATTINLTIPYPFVTQGAQPVHIYGGVTTTVSNGTTCFVPTGTGLPLSSLITLANYGATPTFATTTTVAVSVPAGFSYVNIHLDFGLKTLGNYSPVYPILNNTTVVNAVNGTNAAWTVPYLQGYSFSDGSSTGSVQSENVFKNDPGIGGLVLTDSGDPVANVVVRIYNSSDQQVAALVTDSDGWYMWQYKYTGKASAFTVKLPAYNKSQTVTLKSNSFQVVNFTVP